MDSDSSHKNQPNIFEYYDYRAYLRDKVTFERERTSIFSNRYIVQKAGFKSPTALKHVIDGKRNLSLESAHRFATALKIKGIRRHYFLTLVLFNQALTVEEREKYLNELSVFSSDSMLTIDSLWWIGSNVLRVKLCNLKVGDQCLDDNLYVKKGVTYSIAVDTIACSTLGVHVGWPDTIFFTPVP